MPQVQQPKVNINHATLEELISVNGLGPSLSKRIIDQRPYEQLSDLVRVAGINEIKLASLLPSITLENRDTQTRIKEKSTEIQIDDQSSTSTNAYGKMPCTLFENHKEQQAAILIILGGFFLGLFLLLVRRKSK